MVQVSSVRQAVPAQRTPIAAGALQGLASHFKLQQGKEAKRKEDLMSILPALASMRQLSSAQPGEEGAFEIAGQWFKIGQPSLTEAEKLAQKRGEKIDLEMSEEYRNQTRFDEWYRINGWQIDNEKDEKKRSKLYAAARAKFGLKPQEVVDGAKKVIDDTTGKEKKYKVTNPDTGKSKIVGEAIAQQARDEWGDGSVTEHKGFVEGVGDYFTDEEGDTDVGKVLQAAPMGLYGASKVLPALRLLNWPAAVGLSGLATGANMYSEHQQKTGGRPLWEDTKAYAERTGNPQPWSVGQQMEDWFGGGGAQAQPQAQQQAPQQQAPAPMSMPMPVPQQQQPMQQPMQQPAMSQGMSMDPITLNAIAQMMSMQQPQQSMQR